MHECISPCACCVALISPSCVSPYPLCVLVHPSHPSRAVHLYLSQTSIEIDSSDGMISDPSTPDSSSSEEDERSSDDDGGDDSDWGGGNRKRGRETDMKPARKFAGGMPRWHPWIRFPSIAKRRPDEVSTAAESKTCTLLKWKRCENFSFRVSEYEQREKAMHVLKTEPLKQEGDYILREWSTENQEEIG